MEHVSTLDRDLNQRSAVNHQYPSLDFLVSQEDTGPIRADFSDDASCFQDVFQLFIDLGMILIGHVVQLVRKWSCVGLNLNNMICRP